MSDNHVTLPLPIEPSMPRDAAALDLQARLHRRLGLSPPAASRRLPKAAGLEYETGGRPDGEPVLLMHAGAATSFAPLMTEPELASRYRLVRYHRRGYAGSDPLPDDASVIAVHVSDALALLDHLGIERAHVVSHSGSGVVALELAVAAPTRVRSLVLAEPAIHTIDPRTNDVMRRVITPMIELAGAGDAGRAMERWMRGLSLTWRAELTRTVPGGPQQTIDDAEAFFADVAAIDAWTFDHERVADLDAPVLYVVSDEAPPLVHRMMGSFVDVLPSTRTATIPRATHMLPTDEPRRFAETLAAFFGALEV